MVSRKSRDFEEIESALARQELELGQALGRRWEFYRHDQVTRQHWTVWLMDESGAGLIGPDTSNLGPYLGAIFFEAEPQQEADCGYFSVQYTLYEKGALRLSESQPSVDSAVQAELADAAASVGLELSPDDYQASSGILPTSEARALAAALAGAGTDLGAVSAEERMSKDLNPYIRKPSCSSEGGRINGC